jgi:probable blue pigment (indigoidine) exporter
MLFAWALLAERPRLSYLAGAGLGIVGVCLMLFTGTAAADPLGVLASVSAMIMSSTGYVLAKRWGSEVDVLASTSWQLIAGGLILLPFAVAAEGAPPALDASEILGFGYVTIIATALAFTAWFAGLRRLPAATVGLVGLLNPVTGVLLGTVIAGENLTARQVCGLVLVFGGILLGQRAAVRTRAVAARATASSSAPLRSPAEQSHEPRGAAAVAPPGHRMRPSRSPAISRSLCDILPDLTRTRSASQALRKVI